MKCRRCFEHPATSIATGLCVECLYREQVGDDAARRQTQAYRDEKERERKRRSSRAKGAR